MATRRIGQQGERHPRAKLTAEQVRRIRASTEPGPAVAAREGISRMQVSRIRRLENWISLR